MDGFPCRSGWQCHSAFFVGWLHVDHAAGSSGEPTRRCRHPHTIGPALGVAGFAQTFHQRLIEAGGVRFARPAQLTQRMAYLNVLIHSPARMAIWTIDRGWQCRDEEAGKLRRLTRDCEHDRQVMQDTAPVAQIVEWLPQQLDIPAPR
jgi:hypothetical protein